MIVSKKTLYERFKNAYWSVRAQRHLHQTIRLAAHDPEYARQQIDVLLEYVLTCGIEERDPGTPWVANSEPPPEERGDALAG